MHYVDAAQKFMDKLYQGGENRNAMITTSKIRGLLSGISDIYNDVVQLPSQELSEDIKEKIHYLKVQFIYESGRDDKVKNFIRETKLLEFVDKALISKKDFIRLEKYMEALVAYHRYYGGKDE